MIEENRNAAQKKVKTLLDEKYYKKVELAKLLNISYTSLHTRLRDCNWSGNEVNIIMGL